MRTAAERAVPADLVDLRRCVDEHRAAAGTVAVPAHMDEFLHKDMAFHRQIAAMTGNAIYVALSQAMFEWLAEFHAGLVRLHGAEQLTIDEHEAIFARIAARDGDGAAEAMTRHLTRANLLYRQFEGASGIS